jgi:uncharacterized protein DUF1775
VDVLPTTVERSTAAEFTVRVPTEREVPTTAVTVRFPSAVTVFAFQPTPGWTRTVLKKSDGTITGVRYTGGRIAVGEYQDFTFLGTPFGPLGQTAWKALQTYADGKVKPWTGPPEKPGAVSEEGGPTAPGPAAAVQIVARGGTTTASSVPVSTSSSSGDDSGAGIWLGIIAIIFAGGALLATGFLWSTRPMALPEDPPEPRPEPRGDAKPKAAPEPQQQAKEPQARDREPRTPSKRRGRR